MSEHVGGREPAFDYMANPLLLEAATPAAVSAFVARMGERFAQAHLSAEHVEFGEALPPLSVVSFDHEDLRQLPDLRRWDNGELQYAPPLLFNDDGGHDTDHEFGEATVPAAVSVAYVADNHHGLRGTRITRGLHLVPSLADEQSSVHQRTIQVDEAMHERAFTPDQVRRAASAKTDDEVLAAEDAACAAMGLRHDVITRLELVQLARLASGIVVPGRVKIIAAS